MSLAIPGRGRTCAGRLRDIRPSVGVPAATAVWSGPVSPHTNAAQRDCSATKRAIGQADDRARARSGGSARDHFPQTGSLARSAGHQRHAARLGRRGNAAPSAAKRSRIPAPRRPARAGMEAHAARRRPARRAPGARPAPPRLARAAPIASRGVARRRGPAERGERGEMEPDGRQRARPRRGGCRARSASPCRVADAHARARERASTARCAGLQKKSITTSGANRRSRRIERERLGRARPARRHDQLVDARVALEQRRGLRLDHVGDARRGAGRAHRVEHRAASGRCRRGSAGAPAARGGRRRVRRASRSTWGPGAANLIGGAPAWPGRARATPRPSRRESHVPRARTARADVRNTYPRRPRRGRQTPGRHRARRSSTPRRSRSTSLDAMNAEQDARARRRVLPAPRPSHGPRRARSASRRSRAPRTRCCSPRAWRRSRRVPRASCGRRSRGGARPVLRRHARRCCAGARSASAGASTSWTRAGPRPGRRVHARARGCSTSSRPPIPTCAWSTSRRGRGLAHAHGALLASTTPSPRRSASSRSRSAPTS